MNLILSCTFSFFLIIKSNIKTQIRMVRDFWDTLHTGKIVLFLVDMAFIEYLFLRFIQILKDYRVLENNVVFDFKKRSYFVKFLATCISD